MDYLKIKILVVEDNLQDYIIFKEILGQIRDFFIHIDHAESMAEAMEILKSSEFDIVFLDLFLPDSFGQETFTEIEPHVKSAPIVILSGLSDKNIALDIVKLGAQDYIVKGEFDATLLEKSIIYSIERKRYQDRIAQGERKFRSTFQSVAVAIGEYDYTKLKEYLDSLRAEGITDFDEAVKVTMDNFHEFRGLLNAVQINPATLSLYECQSDEEFDDNAVKFYIPESCVHLKQLMKAVWNGQTSYEGEAAFKTLSGRKIYTWKQAKFLGNDLGYYRMLISTSDITQLKAKEEEVMQQSHIIQGISEGTAGLLANDDLNAALDSALESISTVLRADVISITYFDEEDGDIYYRLVKGWSKKGLPELVAETDRIKLSDVGLEEQYQILQTGQCIEVSAKDIPNYHQGGPSDYAPKHMLTAPILEADKLIGSLNLKRIIFDWKWTEFEKSSLLTMATNIGTAISKNDAHVAVQELNENLEQMVKDRTAQMETAIRDLQAFSYSVSHDLRAPLRAISGFSQVLAEETKDTLSKDGKEYLGHILKGAGEMSQLIDDLLGFSRLGSRKLEKSIIQMETLVNEVIQELIALAPGRNIEIQLEPIPDCLGDRAMIKQVLVNLICNAIKYTSQEERAQISIKARQIDGMVDYSISDNGVGFDMAYSDKLFGVFQRLHPDEEFHGTGVGLAIVDRVIKRHQGTIGVDAAVGEGATFTFSLPAPDEAFKNQESMANVLDES